MKSNKSCRSRLASCATKASIGGDQRLQFARVVRDGLLAKSLGYTGSGDKPQPFNGYYFRILTKQGEQAPGGAKDYVVGGKMTGGFAILGYPAEYRDSGIMTFMVGKGGPRLSKRFGRKDKRSRGNDH